MLSSFTRNFEGNGPRVKGLGPCGNFSQALWLAKWLNQAVAGENFYHSACEPLLESGQGPRNLCIVNDLAGDRLAAHLLI
jgi:hypothetical protein